MFTTFILISSLLTGPGFNTPWNIINPISGVHIGSPAQFVITGSPCEEGEIAGYLTINCGNGSATYPITCVHKDSIPPSGLPGWICTVSVLNNTGELPCTNGNCIATFYCNTKPPSNYHDEDIGQLLPAYP